MHSANPYAPPQTNPDDQSCAAQEMWRDGKTLVLRTGSEFPHRCIRCNHPAVEPKRPCKLTWHPPGWYLLILLNILIYAIVATIVQKRTEVQIGLCALHQRRVLAGRIVGWGGLVAMLLLLVLAAILDSSVPVGICAVLVLPWALAAIILNRLVTVARIDKDLTRVKGCGPAFLASLPSYSDR